MTRSRGTAIKLTLGDGEILQAIKSEQLRDYLQAHGWYFDRPFLENATIWLKQEPERGEFEILLPNKQNLGDYVARIREVIETLEVVENRSQAEILSDLITIYPNINIQGVIIQIASPNADKLSGEITLLGVFLDKLHPIKLELVDHDYILAIKAYQERLPVICHGDLIKEDSGFIFKNIQQFSLDSLG
ncbi:MAG: hypothetical protein QNJ47_25730 [Nostocaceae cyanobacterium]|nr:hypothetical protein [Nostocaceae cyanobacterium]